MRRGDFYRGKVAAISGASAGLGALLAMELARRGAALVLFARRRDKLEQVAERCRQEQPQSNPPAPIVVVAGDVANPADCARFAQAAAQIGANNGKCPPFTSPPQAGGTEGGRGDDWRDKEERGGDGDNGGGGSGDEIGGDFSPSFPQNSPSFPRKRESIAARRPPQSGGLGAAPFAAKTGAIAPDGLRRLDSRFRGNDEERSGNGKERHGGESGGDNGGHNNGGETAAVNAPPLLPPRKRGGLRGGGESGGDDGGHNNGGETAAANAPPLLPPRKRGGLKGGGESGGDNDGHNNGGESRTVVHPQVVRPQTGGADLLICCAGASMWARFDEVADVALFRQLMEINYLGVCHCVHFMLPQLRARRGMLAAVSSIQGKIGAPLHSGYCAAKHALQGLLASLRLELRGEVAVTAVLPHWIRGTDLRASALIGGSNRPHGKDAIDAADCAARIIKALPKKPREIYIPAKLRALPIIAALSPALADAIVAGAVKRENARGERD